jgi:hypothetical protein
LSHNVKIYELNAALTSDPWASSKLFQLTTEKTPTNIIPGIVNVPTRFLPIILSPPRAHSRLSSPQCLRQIPRYTAPTIPRTRPTTTIPRVPSISSRRSWHRFLPRGSLRRRYWRPRLLASTICAIHSRSRCRNGTWRDWGRRRGCSGCCLGELFHVGGRHPTGC